MTRTTSTVSRSTPSPTRSPHAPGLAAFWTRDVKGDDLEGRRAQLRVLGVAGSAADPCHAPGSGLIVARLKGVVESGGKPHPALS
jgi:hypothetical protein